MAAGIALVAWFPALPPWYLCPLLPLPWLLCRRWRGRRFHVLSLAFLIGLLWGIQYGFDIRRGLLPPSLEQQPLLLRGRVVDLVESGESFRRPLLRLQLRVEQCLRIPGGACGADLRRVQLVWYEPASRPRSGETWQFQVQLRRPRGLANPGGFDYEGWLVAQRLGALGSIGRDADNRRLAAASPWSVDTWRGRIHDDLQRRLESARHRDLLLALLLGDGSAIGREQWANFRATGTVHLFVVSGLHIALTGGALLWLARLWWRSPWAGGRRLHYALGCVPAVLAALLYALLAGFNLPIQRALVMFAVAAWASVSWREGAPAGAFVTALWLVLLGDPLAVRNAGFWFSFITVASILLALCGRRPVQNRRGRWWRAQWAVFAASLPVLLALSGQFTLLALPANALAVPWSTLVTMPLALAALLLDPWLPALGAALWRRADDSLEWLWRYLLWLEQHGRSWIWQPLQVDDIALVFAAALALLLLLPRGAPGRRLAPLLLLPLLAPQADAPPPGSYRVTVIDVGQGLSVLVQTASHSLLYDTGPVFGSGTSAAELAILPLLQRRGVARLDALVVSHRDSDHAGGWRVIRERVPVRRMLVGDALGAGDEIGCRAGQRWRWDGVDFAVLYPALRSGRGNNNSCVLQISVGAGAALLSGDIERAGEWRLLDNAELRRASLLLAPHHGSRSSSDAAFVERVQPGYVVFSTGYRNRFHHPHPSVVERYRAAGAQLFNTADSGALMFTLDAGGVAQITEQRARDRHYWQD